MTPIYNDVLHLLNPNIKMFIFTPQLPKTDLSIILSAISAIYFKLPTFIRLALNRHRILKINISFSFYRKVIALPVLDSWLDIWTVIYCCACEYLKEWRQMDTPNQLMKELNNILKTFSQRLDVLERTFCDSGEDLALNIMWVNGFFNLRVLLQKWFN